MECFVVGKSDSKSHQAHQKTCSLCATKPLKEEVEQLPQKDIITLLGMDERVEWFNSFVLIPKHNGKVRLCLYLVRLN